MHVKFSEAAVRKLPVGVHWDTETPGLALRVRDGGSRTYYFVKRQKESRDPLWQKLGRAGSLTLGAARVEVQRLYGVMASGIDLAIERAARRAEPTLWQLITEYIKGRKGQRSTEADRELLQRWIGKLPDGPPRKHGRARVKPPGSVDWSNRRAGGITKGEIRELIVGIVATGKKRTAGCLHELLHAAFAWGMEHGRCRGNPASGIEAPNSEQRERFARVDELPVLLKAISKMSDPWGDLFALLLYVGYRRSAIQRMRWIDVHFTEALWIVPAEHSKNGSTTALPLTGRAHEILKRRHKANAGRAPWVFPGNTAQGHIGRPKRAWDVLLADCGLSDLRLHDLRRTLGSHLAMSGESLPMIGRVLGHKDPKSTAIYARLQLDSVRGALDRVHKRFGNAAKQKARSAR